RRSAAPEKFTTRRESKRRASFSSPIARPPATASTAGFTRIAIWLGLRNAPRNGRAGSSEANDDLAEHLPTLQARKPFANVLQRDLAVDHRMHARGHLVQTLANIAHGGAERSDDPILL